MTALNFPDTPYVGQIFVAGTKSWTWSGIAWNASGGSGGADNQLLVAIPPIQYDIVSQEISIDTNAISMASQSVSSDITLSKNTKYFVDTNAPRTLTLPAAPALGDELFVYDATGLSETNNITILRNGNKINGLDENAIIDVSQSTSAFTYTGSTIGWRFD